MQNRPAVVEQVADQAPEFFLGYRDEEGLPSKPTDRQFELEELWKNPVVRFILVHGGTRGGKTAGAIKTGIIDEMLQRPGLSACLCHVNNNSLHSSLLFHLFNMVPEHIDLGGQRVQIRFHNKRLQQVRIVLPGLVHPTRGYTALIDYRPVDPSKNLHQQMATSGASYGVIIWDQCEKGNVQVWRALLNRLTEAPRKIILTANPHPNTWFVPLFVIPDPTNTKQIERFRSLLMNPTDNPYLDPDYVETLKKQLPEALWKRFIEGSYAPVSGRCLDIDRKHIVKVPHKIPSDWAIYEAVDYGYNDPCAVQWWGVDRKNRCHLLMSETFRQTPPYEVAKQMLVLRRALIRRGREAHEDAPRFMRTVCDPSMGNRQFEGRSVVTEMGRARDGDGWQVFCEPATAKGLPKEKQLFSRIMMLKQFERDGNLLIGDTNLEWVAQESIWVWQEEKNPDKPADFRQYDADGNVIHHFDHMMAMTYFISFFLLRELGRGEGGGLKPDPRDFDYPGTSKPSDQGFVQRFRDRCGFGVKTEKD